jgi:hypothetical protein|tara:strand:+ start:55 stop:204 length:150 start_codon:yes stop_codon:yes gene_type:complete
MSSVYPKIPKYKLSLKILKRSIVGPIPVISCGIEEEKLLQGLVAAHTMQ